MSYVTPRSVSRLEEELAELEKVSQQKDLPEEEEVIEQEEVEEVVEPVEVSDNLNKEEETFKKRYSDLRRHNQKVVEDLKAKEAELEKLRKEKTGAGLPTAEEAEAWALANPKAAAIIRAIVAEEAAPSSKEVLEIKAKLNRAEQEALILKTHNDFYEVVNSDAFQDWAEEQPEGLQKLIFSSEAKDVIWSLSQYKKEKVAAKVNPSKEAAKVVSKTPSSAPDTKTKGRFSESQVQKMSMSEYEKNADAIAESMRTGNFVYDLSGGAR